MKNYWKGILNNYFFFLLLFRNHGTLINLFQCQKFTLTFFQIKNNKAPGTMYQRDQFTFIAFSWSQKKKAFDSIPTYDILIKFSNISICSKCLKFITNLYLTSKVRTKLLMVNFQKKFPLHCDICQGSPLSSILFNIYQ